MKFKYQAPKEPSILDMRNVKKFAWFPVYCKDHVVWLESYISIQQYQCDIRLYHGLNRITERAWKEIDRKEIS
jgi:hypothetical protein